MPQKVRCEVADLVNHGGHVYSISLKPDAPAPRFSAGQFLHLALDPYVPGDFWPESRPFSIASSPTDRNLLTLTYAVQGQFTRRMESELSIGAAVWIKLPFGDFKIRAGQDSCLLAGGTGVTAFTAFFAGLATDYPRPVYAFYGARRAALLIYRSLLEGAATRCSKLKVYFLVEEDPGPGTLAGRLDLDLVWKNVADPSSLIYYLSGPPIMLKTLSGALQQRGIPPTQIVIDAWE